MIRCDNGALYVNTCNDSTCAYCSGAQQYTSNQCFVYPWYNQAAKYDVLLLLLFG